MGKRLAFTYKMEHILGSWHNQGNGMGLGMIYLNPP